MKGSEFEEKYARPAIGVLAAYESLAIASGAEVWPGPKLPTITNLVGRLYRTWWGQAFLWGVWGWLTCHFFREATVEAMKQENKRLGVLRWKSPSTSKQSTS